MWTLARLSWREWMMMINEVLEKEYVILNSDLYWPPTYDPYYYWPPDDLSMLSSYSKVSTSRQTTAHQVNFAHSMVSEIQQKRTIMWPQFEVYPLRLPWLQVTTAWASTLDWLSYGLWAPLFVSLHSSNTLLVNHIP